MSIERGRNSLEGIPQPPRSKSSIPLNLDAPRQRYIWKVPALAGGGYYFGPQKLSWHDRKVADMAHPRPEDNLYVMNRGRKEEVLYAPSGETRTVYAEFGRGRGRVEKLLLNNVPIDTSYERSSV